MNPWLGTSKVIRCNERLDLQSLFTKMRDRMEREQSISTVANRQAMLDGNNWSVTLEFLSH